MPAYNFAYINKKYIFPIQFVVGCIGNILNLIVLNSRGMRTKTNFFLSAMAVADLGCFVSMFPIILFAIYDIRSYSTNHDLFYHYFNIPLITFANWFSAASIWLSLGVTVERLIAIKFPLLARTYWKKRRIVFFIVLVYVMALVFSLYHFAWRTVVRVSNRTNGSTNTTNMDYVHEWRTPSENDSVRYWYVHISHGFAATTIILLPLIMLIVLSSYLVHYLRLNTDAVRGLRAGNVLLRRGERRVTSTVVVLITAFTLFNLPSGVFAVIQIWFNQLTRAEKQKLGWYHELAELVNALVFTHKAINFGLYCTASSRFRRKLAYMINGHWFLGRVVRTLNNRFSISSANGDGVVTASCKYSFMTTVFHEVRCCNYHPIDENMLTRRISAGAKRRTYSIDTNARSRTCSTSLQLHPLREYQQGSPRIEQKWSAF